MNSLIEQVMSFRRFLRLAHHIPGRVRLKYSFGILAKVARFKQQDIEQTLAQFPAFQGYQLNSATGSIVIEYDPQLIKPQTIEQLFAAEEQLAIDACHQIAAQLSLTDYSQEVSA